MNRMAAVGIVLVVLGAAAFVVRRVTYTDREEVLDIGPIEATAEVEESIEVPSWLGGVLLGAGVIFIALGSARRA
jgi:hypothetical protein